MNPATPRHANYGNIAPNYPDGLAPPTDSLAVTLEGSLVQHAMSAQDEVVGTDGIDPQQLTDWEAAYKPDWGKNADTVDSSAVEVKLSDPAIADDGPESEASTAATVLAREQVETALTSENDKKRSILGKYGARLSMASLMTLGAADYFLIDFANAVPFAKWQGYVDHFEYMPDWLKATVVSAGAIGFVAAEGMALGLPIARSEKMAGAIEAYQDYQAEKNASFRNSETPIRRFLNKPFIGLQNRVEKHRNAKSLEQDTDINLDDSANTSRIKTIGSKTVDAIGNVRPRALLSTVLNSPITALIKLGEWGEAKGIKIEESDAGKWKKRFGHFLVDSFGVLAVASTGKMLAERGRPGDTKMPIKRVAYISTLGAGVWTGLAQGLIGIHHGAGNLGKFGHGVQAIMEGAYKGFESVVSVDVAHPTHTKLATFTVTAVAAALARSGYKAAQVQEENAGQETETAEDTAIVPAYYAS